MINGLLNRLYEIRLRNHSNQLSISVNYRNVMVIMPTKYLREIQHIAIFTNHLYRFTHDLAN